MADILTPRQRSKLMSAIRSKGNRNTELRLAAILKTNGVRGWRRHPKVLGKPDFVFHKARLAIFVDGCFWHGCCFHCRMPKSRQDFWTRKILKNKERDREVNKLLKRAGWKVLRIWEHSLLDPLKVTARTKAALASKVAGR